MSERFIAELKQLVDRHGLAWNYAPLHQHLSQARERGELAIDLTPVDRVDVNLDWTADT
jgi:hypothetical protein